MKLTKLKISLGSAICVVAVIPVVLNAAVGPQDARQVDVLVAGSRKVLAGKSLLFEISTNQKICKVGDAVDLTIRLRNVGKDTCRFTKSDPLLIYKFDITRPDGKQAQPTTEGRRALSPISDPSFVATGTLAPRGLYSVELPLNKWYKMDVPGRYEISVSRTVWNSQDPIHDGTTTLHSNKLALMITAASEPKHNSP